MTTVNYPSPVTVNGYSCKNCTDVDLAKQHIDPAHPKDGPYGVDAKDNPPSLSPSGPRAQTPAVTFGGALAGASQASGAGAPIPAAQPGQQLNVFA